MCPIHNFVGGGCGGWSTMGQVPMVKILDILQCISMPIVKNGNVGEKATFLGFMCTQKFHINWKVRNNVG